MLCALLFMLTAALPPARAAPLPPAWSKALLERGLSLGMSLAGTGGPLAGWRQAQLDGIFAAGHTLRLQFPREDLGFRCAPLPSSPPLPPPWE
jgi:hypothetical protein